MREEEASVENVCDFRPDIVAVERTAGTPTTVGATYRQFVMFACRRSVLSPLERFASRAS